MSNRTKGKSIGFCVAAALVLVAAGAITRLSITDSPKKASELESSVKDYSSKTASGYTASYSDSRNILKIPSDSEKSQSSKSALGSAAQSGKISDSLNKSEQSGNKTDSDKKSEASRQETAAKAKNAAGTKTVSFALPLKGDIIRKFDMTQLVYSKTFGDMRVHNGIDIKAKDGATVGAAADGTVKEVREDPLWGNMIVIDHGGSILSYYCGLNDVAVKVGDSVKLSKIIGTVGECAAECLDETHLHFSVTQNGEYVSPLKIMGLGE